MITLQYYLIVSTVLFTIGILGLLVRKNIITVFMSIEIILNSVNIAFVAFSRYLGNVDGQIYVFFIFAIAAAEAAVGLALVVAWFKLKESISLDEIKDLRG